MLWTSAPGWSFLATRSIPATKTGYGHVLDDLHLGSIHSEWRHSVPWGPWTAGDLQFHLWALSIGTRLPDESWNSVDSVRSVYLLHWGMFCQKCSQICLLLCLQPSPSLHSTFGSSLSGLWLSQVTCISSMGQPAVTCTSCSKHCSPSTTARSWTWPMHCSQGESNEDGFHCFWVQSSGNLAKYIHHHIITPLLVFQLKVKPCKGI